MTTLNVQINKEETTQKWVVIKTIYGDLSYSFDVKPRSEVYVENGQILYSKGHSLHIRSVTDVQKFIRWANKLGYKRASEEWMRTYTRNPFYTMRRVSGKDAVKYAFYENAYGDYAEKVRKRSGG